MLFSFFVSALVFSTETFIELEINWIEIKNINEHKNKKNQCKNHY